MFTPSPVSTSAAEATATLPPVVLVHGIFRDHRIMRFLRKAFAAAGRRTLCPNLRPNDGSLGIGSLAKQLDEYLEENLALGEQCDVIAHSLGGIVARTYVQRHPGASRIRRLITLASPHHGTLTAWLWPTQGARELRPGSDFLRDLARDVHRLDGVLVASYWTPLDLVIVPPRSSELPVGRNQCRILPHHRALVTNARLARELVVALDAP